MGIINLPLIIIGAVTLGMLTAGLLMLVARRKLSRHAAASKYYDQHLSETFLASLKNKMNRVFWHYQDNAGMAIEALKQGEPLLCHYVLQKDFFLLYDGRGFLLNKVSDKQLRGQIIKTYIMMKRMDETIRTNNDLLDEFEKRQRAHRESGHRDKGVIESKDSLKEHASLLKREHYQFKKVALELLGALDGEHFIKRAQGSLINE